MSVPLKKVSEDENRGELMVIEPNEMHPSSLPLVLKSGGVLLPSQGDYGPFNLIVMASRDFSLATLREGLTISSQREPIISSAFVVTSFSG
ncbi:hypothetical protein AMTRI_Chr10g3050 [Amborella trichopoda]